MLRRGMEVRDGLAVMPLALDVQAVGVEPPAAVAVREVVRVEILEWFHGTRDWGLGTRQGGYYWRRDSLGGRGLPSESLVPMSRLLCE